jgi:hypothetical protein
MFNYLPKTTTSSSSSSVTRTGTSASTRYYNEQALKLFIKFLTMDMNFYGYTTLNINTDDYLYDDKFYIKGNPPPLPEQKFFFFRFFDFRFFDFSFFDFHF